MSKIETKEINGFILQKLSGKIKRSGLKESDIGPDFDLVKSGLVDSLSFVDLVVDLEQNYNIEIDFEEAFSDELFTTLSGLSQQIVKGIHDRN